MTKMSAPVRSFEDLDVFKRAYRIALEAHKSSQNFPALEQRALGDQMRRASKFICGNIAEGFGKQRNSKLEFKRFLRIAIGSADELRVWSRFCLDLGYIDDVCWKRWRDEYKLIAQMLQSLHSKSSSSSN